MSIRVGKGLIGWSIYKWIQLSEFFSLNVSHLIAWLSKQSSNALILEKIGMHVLNY